MLALGINIGRPDYDECQSEGFGGHDSAAVLVVDGGDVVAAVEEERLSRIKHTNYFPRLAVRWVLKEAGVRINEVDFIAVQFSKVEADAHGWFANFWDPFSPRFANGQEFGAASINREFGIDLSEKIRFCHHHLAHAWSAFYPSGFEAALVITLDGDGGDGRGGSACGTIGTATRQRGVEIKKILPAEASLGNTYSDLSSILGYRRFDEYKVMGLAPYGDPRVYRSLFAKFYSLGDGGNYTLVKRSMAAALLREAGLLSSARKRGEPFTQLHKDYAAALQELLEKIAMHIVTHAQKSTGLKRLCLAGGVAHNCTLNGRILESGLFDQVFVQPASHDAGASYGAAIATLFQAKAPLTWGRATSQSVGPCVPSDEVLERELAAWSDFVSYERVADVEVTTARLLADGGVVGWVQGRAEFGPRALGNRSILADPRPPENKTRINAMVKKRESYRPFAPSVLEEHLHEVFEVPEGVADLSHMLFVVKVRPQYQPKLGATTHVDGTARVQSVSRADAPRYWKLIDEFRQLTGMPVLLNTSFNNNVEPIVTSVEEALTCFLTTEIEFLVVGDYLVRKRFTTLPSRACLSLVPSLPVGRRLIKGTTSGRDGVEVQSLTIESTTTDFFLRKRVEISRELYGLLVVDSDECLAARATALGLDEPALDTLAGEVLGLWQERVLKLRPRGSA